MSREFLAMRRRLLLPAVAASALAANAVRAQPASTARLALAFASTLTAHDIDAFAALIAEDYVQHQANTVPPPGRSAKALTVAYFAARLQAGGSCSIPATFSPSAMASSPPNWGAADIAGLLQQLRS